MRSFLLRSAKATSKVVLAGRRVRACRLREGYRTQQAGGQHFGQEEDTVIETLPICQEDNAGSKEDVRKLAVK
jgi:hypothetical protein